MNTTKFRAKHKGVWVYFNLQKGFSEEGYQIYKELVEQKATFNQFTGLLDQDSKEIYEGDIIKWEEKAEAIYSKDSVGDFEKGKNRGLVIFNEDNSKYVAKLKNDKWYYEEPLEYMEWKRKVIGNIYETPNLFK